MERYIGIDVHAASCTLAVVSERGRLLRTMVVETNGEALVDAVRGVAGRRRVVFEEGTQAGWLVELLERHTHELVVALVPSTRGQKNDQRDAVGLAQSLRLGAVKRQVYKHTKQFRELKELARVYRMVTGDVVRTKNRIKSVYRARGVSTPGKGVYSAKARAGWLDALDPPSRLAAEMLYAELDVLQPLKLRAEKAMVTTSHRHAVSKRLETIPGLGAIRVAQLLPIVVTPFRFRTRRQFWSYCGLGIVMRSSSDWVQTQEGWQRAQLSVPRGLNKHSNRTLKAVFKGAATTVLQAWPEDPLHAHYRRLLDQGTRPHLAKLTLARRLAAIALRLWKTEEVYDPAKLTTTSTA